MTTFKPSLSILPSAQRALWPELGATPSNFTLYGGTALALRLSHRTSVDFDFFSNEPFDPDHLARSVPYLVDAERIQMAPNTLTCKVERNGGVLVSYFGGLGYGLIRDPDQPEDIELNIASLLDIAGTKVGVVQQRAESKDYLDIDALIQNGVDLPTCLAAGRVVRGSTFAPMLALKALSFFDDVPDLPAAVQKRLTAAVGSVSPNRLPRLDFVRKAV